MKITGIHLRAWPHAIQLLTNLFTPDIVGYFVMTARKHTKQKTNSEKIQDFRENFDHIDAGKSISTYFIKQNKQCPA